MPLSIRFFISLAEFPFFTVYLAVKYAGIGNKTIIIFYTYFKYVAA